MNFLFDLILLGVFLLFVMIGVRRGFVRSAVHFVGSILAASLSSVLGGAVAKWVFQAFFRESLVAKISESINALGVENMSSALRGLIGSLPAFLVRSLEKAGVTVGLLEGVVAHSTKQAAVTVADTLAPVFISFLKVLAVFVLFALFMVVVRVAADALEKVFYLPILHQVDGLLGGVCGFLLALVSVWIVISGIQVFLPMLAPSAQAKLQTTLDHSIIAKLMIGLNPLKKMFG